MNMRAYALLLFVVGCSGVQWKPLSDFRETFKEYSAAAVDTISSIQNILDNSRNESGSFLNDLFTKHPIVTSIAGIRSDECNTLFINEEQLRISFQNQVEQLQVPLNERVVDIRERLKIINTTLGYYEIIAESKYRSCKSVNGSCLEETNDWLQSSIDTLSFALCPNCSRYAFRSVCSPDEYKCKTKGYCIPGRYYCDGKCDCYDDCRDESIQCGKNCEGFRCSETFECIPWSKKCNGVDDCGNGSDENGCPTPSTTTTLPPTTSSSSTTPTPTTPSTTTTPPPPTTASSSPTTPTPTTPSTTNTTPPPTTASSSSTTPPPSSTPEHYTHENCSTVVGDFLCKNNKCIGFKQVCDGNNDCGDSSDETNLCKIHCSPECGKNGLVCLRGPEGAKCLNECPPGTYETTKGCSINPEKPFSSLPSIQEVLEDTPRLRTRYEARLNYLKTKTMLEFLESLEEVVKCKMNELKMLFFSIDVFKKLLKKELLPVIGINETSGTDSASLSTPPV